MDKRVEAKENAIADKPLYGCEKYVNNIIRTPLIVVLGILIFSEFCSLFYFGFGIVQLTNVLKEPEGKLLQEVIDNAYKTFYEAVILLSVFTVAFVICLIVFIKINNADKRRLEEGKKYFISKENDKSDVFFSNDEE